MNRQELLDKILASREELDAALAQISDARMSLVILHGEWSVKDLIGHLGFWENFVLSTFDVLKAAKIPESIKNMDVLNVQKVTEMRTWPLAEVVRFEHAAYQKILELVKQASDLELFDPNYFSWTEGRSFGEIISDNSWGHYEEHLPELISWLKRIA